MRDSSLAGVEFACFLGQLERVSADGMRLGASWLKQQMASKHAVNIRLRCVPATYPWRRNVIARGRYKSARHPTYILQTDSAPQPTGR